ncbi:hypothetical protein BsWGS_12007 [Bradybaena similaris]
MQVYTFLAAAVLVAMTSCNPYTTPPVTCVYKGVSYPVGPIVTGDPCDICTCTETGDASCAVIDCFIPFASPTCPYGTVPVKKEGQCCVVCETITTTRPYKKYRKHQ